jgi:monoterpene epsilon-lactone hydrolase
MHFDARTRSLGKDEMLTGIVHSIDAADRNIMNQIRTAAAAGKGHVDREPFDAMMEQTPDGAGITYEPDMVGGVSGVWCRPSAAPADRAILYIHRGAYIAGSAAAFRHLAGQIAARAGTAAFVPDYRLAPEHRFPAAFDDAHAAYRGLAEPETGAIAIVGDSAGGGLALALIAATCAEAATSGALAPCAGVAMSPWTDLALTGPSLENRADADPFLTKDALAQAAAQYLAGQDARAPHASPLYGDLRGLPKIQVHTGTDEILLDDARRYAQSALAANVDVALHSWEGMPHVFPSTVGTLKAATQALDLIGTFLRERLDAR